MKLLFFPCTEILLISITNSGLKLNAKFNKSGDDIVIMVVIVVIVVVI